MADGVKLSSGYVELTVKAGNAMRDITAAITGLGKDAEKAGKQAGDALTKQLSKAGKDAGKSVSDELAKATEKAGKDAGDAINKGVTKGAKSAGKSVGDEIGKATKKAADDIAKTKIEPKVTPKVDKDAVKREAQSIPDIIYSEATKAAKSNGFNSFEDVLVDLAGQAGKKMGGVIGDALGDSPVGDFFRDMQGDIAPVIDSVGTFRDALKSAGQGSPLGPVSSTLKDIGTTLGSFTGGSKLETALAGIGGKAAQLASVAGALEQVVALVGDPRTEKVLNGNLGSMTGLLGQNLGTGAAIGFGIGGGPGAAIGAGAGVVATGGEIIARAIQDHEKFKQSMPQLPPAPTTKQQDEGIAGAFALPPAGAPRPSQSPLQDLLQLPGRATGGPVPLRPVPMPGPEPNAPGGMGSATSGGSISRGVPGSAGPIPGMQRTGAPPRAGVTPSGMLFGPGTGTSDSIIGVGADGVPTARVSTGEGIVKKSVMDQGGAAAVAALNSGMQLPGYDGGTNNVGGPPIPMPQPPPVKVPEASSGQAGQFNSWLSQQQGKQYQYGTLYDCSGFMSQIYNQMTGKQMPRFNTESDLAAYGFVRGSQPGTFQLGIHHGGGGPNSHMAGTLPDGRNVESAGNGVQIGAGAHGASDKQFEDHWYLPGSGAGGAGMGGGPAAAPVDPTSAAAAGGPAGIAQRTQGYIPAGAGGSGQAGSSLFSGGLQLGAQAINGVIDQAASAAVAAIGAAGTAGSMGMGGEAAGPAAQLAISMGTQAAKRGVSYGFQMAGIGADALTEILSPFGVPRYFQTDPTQFMPHIGVQPTGVTTGEKAQLQGAQSASGQQSNPALNPGGPVQPGQLTGAQPVGAPVQMAQPQGVASMPVPIGAPPGGAPGAPAGPAVPQPVSPVAPPAPQSGPDAGQPPPKPKTGVGPLDDFLGGLARGGVVGVYDDGGILPAGGIAINKSKRPEPILNDEQWSSVHAAASQLAAPPDSSSSGGNDYSMHFGEGSITVKDVAELEAQLSSKQRLQMMRYAGRP